MSETRGIEAIEADLRALDARVVELDQLIAGCKAQLAAWERERDALSSTWRGADRRRVLERELEEARAQRAWDTYPRYRMQGGAPYERGRDWVVISVGHKQVKAIDHPTGPASVFDLDGKSTRRGGGRLVGFDAEACRARVAALVAAGITR